MEASKELTPFDTYEQVIDWLFVQLPNYQAQGTSAYKPGLDNIKTLIGALGNPQDKFKSVHVAGTNGKGSVVHMISAIYQANEYKVGTFTSPHISDFRERIKINGQMVSEKFVMDFVNAHRKLIDEIGATFFEINTAMAFKAFADKQVDVAVIETGLGGRLDSTNVLLPEVSIITSIGIDHAEFLGNSIPEIAKEKGGIIKPNVPVVVGAEQKEAVEELSLMAIKQHAPIHFPDHEAYEIDLLGMYQQRNAEIAVKAVTVIKDKIPVKDEAVAYGLSHIVQLTNLKGRFQLLQKSPLVILDAAHNPAGVEGLLTEVEELEYDKLHMVYGCSADKDINQIFSMLPKAASYYFTVFNGKRSTRKEVFEEKGKQFGLNYTVYDAPDLALKSAVQHAHPQDLIIIFGTFYMMDEILGSQL